MVLALDLDQTVSAGLDKSALQNRCFFSLFLYLFKFGLGHFIALSIYQAEVFLFVKYWIWIYTLAVVFGGFFGQSVKFKDIH